jgi:transcriptional regulator with XRE-family HTH domain
MLKELRVALLCAGMPQYEVARRAEMTETRLSRIACGRTKPTSEEAIRIARVLDKTVGEIFPFGQLQGTAPPPVPHTPKPPSRPLPDVTRVPPAEPPREYTALPSGYDEAAPNTVSLGPDVHTLGDALEAVQATRRRLGWTQDGQATALLSFIDEHDLLAELTNYLRDLE